MSVKDRVGRTRYVAFRLLGGPLPRSVLASVLPPFAKLTRFDGSWGILRTSHRDRDALLAVLKEAKRVGGQEVRIETLRTSGTIRQAAKALPEGSSVSKRSTPRA